MWLHEWHQSICQMVQKLLLTTMAASVQLDVANGARFLLRLSGFCGSGQWLDHQLLNWPYANWIKCLRKAGWRKPEQGQFHHIYGAIMWGKWVKLTPAHTCARDNYIFLMTRQSELVCSCKVSHHSRGGAGDCEFSSWVEDIHLSSGSCLLRLHWSIQWFLKSLQISGFKLKKATKDLAEEVEHASIWLWVQRKDKARVRG